MANSLFTYTFTRSGIGGINFPVLRSDGQKVDVNDPDFNLFLTNQTAPAPVVLSPTLAVISSTQTAAQAAAAAAAKTFAPTPAQDSAKKIAALETALQNILQTGVI